VAAGVSGWRTARVSPDSAFGSLYNLEQVTGLRQGGLVCRAVGCAGPEAVKGNAKAVVA